MSCVSFYHCRPELRAGCHVRERALLRNRAPQNPLELAQPLLRGLLRDALLIEPCRHRLQLPLRPLETLARRSYHPRDRVVLRPRELLHLLLLPNAAVLKHAGQAAQAANYSATAQRLAKQLRARPATTVQGGEWWADYGVHAASYLINAKNGTANALSG